MIASHFFLFHPSYIHIFSQSVLFTQPFFLFFFFHSLLSSTYASPSPPFVQFTFQPSISPFFPPLFPSNYLARFSFGFPFISTTNHASPHLIIIISYPLLLSPSKTKGRSRRKKKKEVNKRFIWRFGR
ncbi:hypothetical protein, unlikely [Trypanosoma brucei gambiense DAL972]|uniref:Uncharacterized protein n=1 Tax=Trypanosoma brucei gambiense (strain MHOM/CI/86/DAL972) TaxID=679716 RepID=C9ZQG1_TRYB9|nr:hypothetical protein, unlikely [Trypanosoma brucei gambiense DAL972]CBH11641.1 hypothetical protein, unlikely [Trypanosoma brucei gambiense DAL972]|eukprot:XP_011773926.1 hypothetical protein, unlikely [Trypanosoma brucei gambiense DAL972]